jgi:hypothetical protein
MRRLARRMRFARSTRPMAGIGIFMPVFDFMQP